MLMGMRNHFGFDSEVCPKGARLKQNQATDREILPEREKEVKRATNELGAMAGGITLIPERKACETQR